MDIHEHDMFIFLSAGDKAVDVELVGSTGSSKKMKVEANQKRIFHRLDQTVKIDKDSWSPYTARSQLGVCLCTTEKKIFHPGERVHIILYVARSGGKEVEVEITHMEQPLLRKSTKLDASGASIIPLDDLENGPYKVSLFGPRIERESCEFIVAPFTLSPLQTIVEKQSVQNDKITVTAKVMKLNIPYSGPIRVDVRCSYCNGTVVESKNLTVTKGKLTATYSMGGHTGPFTLDFVTPDGSTSTEFLEGTRTEDRQELDLNKIGTLTKCALLSHENAENVRNLFFWESGSSTWPLVLQQAIEKEVQLQALE
nr:hypothetical protein [Candidatus Sigynarchaeota archaeon]